jgi:dihydroorotase
MKIIIKHGRVIDPLSGTDKELDVLIEDDRVVRMESNIDVPDDAGSIDASGCLVLPGLVDMHVHFREPGREDVETIIGGSRSAARGGYTSVCTMPNTEPVIDNQALVRFIRFEAENGPINVFPVAAVSRGSKGEQLTEMGELLDAGAVAFSDDGLPVTSPKFMRRALEYARMFDVPILVHEEDLSLSDEGIMNEGVNSTLLGLKGIPAESEEVMIARDVMLARLTNGRLHVQHVSSAGAVDIIRRAKEEGLKVTCETAPHYFTLTDDAIAEHLSMAKMKPPLRTERDRQAIIRGLKDGTIDAIATDHAPHSMQEKMQEISYAPFGIIGLETAVPLIITELARKHGFEYLDVFSRVTSIPAKILKLDRGYLCEGGPADITVIDPEKPVTVDDGLFASRSRNSPFMGRELFGSVEYTICNGNLVYPFQ